MFGLEKSPQAILFVEAGGVVAYANSNLGELIGIPVKKLIGRSLLEYTDLGIPSSLFQDISTAVGKKEEWHGEVFFEKAPPTGRHTITTCSPIYDEGDKLMYMLILIDDISDEKVFAQRMYTNAHYDAVTGLPNRSYSLEKLEQATLAAKSKESTFTLIHLNLDRFKLINDSRGHGLGDKVLNQIAGRLRNTLYDGDLLGNLGGDKFLILLQNQRDENAVRTALALKSAVNEPLLMEEGELTLSASIGLAIFPDDANSAPELMRCAESAMYYAREQGGDGFYRYRHKPGNGAASRLAIESHLRHAISRNEMSLAFQPIIDIGHNRLVGAEALLRWHNSELKNPSPDKFIQIAEETGLILPIGDWALEEACLHAKRWQAYDPDFVVAVNVCARQFEKGHILTAVERALSKTGLPPRALELEVTERLLMGNDSLTKSILYRLKNMGIRLSLDDFGTGYASLSYLKQYPFDVLKIDRSFVADCQHSEQSRQLIQAIVNMAHSLQMEVVGEGVEQLEQRRLLREAGCDMAQGYLFTPAIPADRFTHWADQYLQVQPG
nr:EAL domain-containing protein [Litorivivens lipolytica]